MGLYKKKDEKSVVEITRYFHIYKHEFKVYYINIKIKKCWYKYILH